MYASSRFLHDWRERSSEQLIEYMLISPRLWPVPVKILVTLRPWSLRGTLGITGKHKKTSEGDRSPETTTLMSPMKSPTTSLSGSSDIHYSAPLTIAILLFTAAVIELLVKSGMAYKPLLSSLLTVPEATDSTEFSVRSKELISKELTDFSENIVKSLGIDSRGDIGWGQSAVHTEEVGSET